MVLETLLARIMQGLALSCQQTDFGSPENSLMSGLLQYTRSGNVAPCDQQSMNVQGRYHERFVPLDDGVDINKSNDVAFAAAASIALYPGNAVE